MACTGLMRAFALSLLYMWNALGYLCHWAKELWSSFSMPGRMDGTCRFCWCATVLLLSSLLLRPHHGAAAARPLLPQDAAPSTTPLPFIVLHGPVPCPFLVPVDCISKLLRFARSVSEMRRVQQHFIYGLWWPLGFVDMGESAKALIDFVSG